MEKLANKNINIGIALDNAFSFYYENNLECLNKIGNITYFSPLNDEKLPENLDFLYIGGGYPEVFKEKLEKNKSMRESIKSALENGLNCYAECGGLMYLCEEIEGSKMVGFFNGKSFLTKRLQHFGYCNVHLKDADININAHEFHKSYIQSSEKTSYEVTKKQYDGELLEWDCGYKKKNTLGGYAHINFLGNLEFLQEIIGVRS